MPVSPRHEIKKRAIVQKYVKKPKNYQGIKLKKFGFVEEPEVKEIGDQLMESF